MGFAPCFSAVWGPHPQVNFLLNGNYCAALLAARASHGESQLPLPALQRSDASARIGGDLFPRIEYAIVHGYMLVRCRAPKAQDDLLLSYFGTTRRSRRNCILRYCSGGTQSSKRVPSCPKAPRAMPKSTAYPTRRCFLGSRSA